MIQLSRQASGQPTEPAPLPSFGGVTGYWRKSEVGCIRHTEPLHEIVDDNTERQNSEIIR
jgi:hypothetical protein